jgi:hypothetical protein
MSCEDSLCGLRYIDYSGESIGCGEEVPEDIRCDVNGYLPVYLRLATLNQSRFRILIRSATQSESGYDSLVLAAREYLVPNPNDRLLIALPDGVVLFDSSRSDNPVDLNANSYANFLARSINDNHNTRVAVLNAQLKCRGFGYEKRLSTTTNRREIYVAVRLGRRYNNDGTVRLSTVPGLLI